MLETFVKKIIARDGEREVVNSSQEEMQNFIVEQLRPDFLDEHVICIKFLVSSCETFEDAEETSWFVNPIYADECIQNDYCWEKPETELDFQSPHYDYPFSTPESRMASEFLPELLLLIPKYPRVSILDKYSEFRNNLILIGLGDVDDDRKYELFIHWLKKHS